MITATQAVKAAIEAVSSLFPGAQRPLLEEIEAPDNNSYWYVTVSFIDPNRDTDGPFSAIVSLKPPRQYRIVKLESESGEVRSVKIRERQNA